MVEREWLLFEREFFGKTNRVAGVAGRGYTADMWGKVLIGVAIAAVVGIFWARPDLMVALLIIVAVGVYGWRHPDLDDWRGH
jgi:hypothetical protein